MAPGAPYGDVMDTRGVWCEAEVMGLTRITVGVHYRGWASTWDEWLPRDSERLAPAWSQVPPWRRQLRVLDRVQVGRVSDACKRVHWENAIVASVDYPTSTVQVMLTSGKTIRMPMDHAKLSRPRTHSTRQCCVLQPYPSSKRSRSQEDAMQRAKRTRLSSPPLVPVGSKTPQEGAVHEHSDNTAAIIENELPDLQPSVQRATELSAEDVASVCTAVLNEAMERLRAELPAMIDAQLRRMASRRDNEEQ